MGVSKNWGKTPQIIHFNRFFYYFHHPFWSSGVVLVPTLQPRASQVVDYFADAETDRWTDSTMILLMAEILKNHLRCIKPVVNNGINYIPINWWVYRISEPSTVYWHPSQLVQLVRLKHLKTDIFFRKSGYFFRARWDHVLTSKIIYSTFAQGRPSLHGLECVWPKDMGR